MSLRDWLDKGWLTEHKPAPREIRELQGIADRDLAECQLPGLSPDWRLGIAYNAALQVATAALAAAGYRTRGEAHHYHAIQSLEFTIGASKALIAQLDAFRKKRNLSGYERAGRVSATEADEMRELAGELRRLVTAWLAKSHPDLV